MVKVFGVTVPLTPGVDGAPGAYVGSIKGDTFEIRYAHPHWIGTLIRNGRSIWKVEVYASDPDRCACLIEKNWSANSGNWNHVLEYSYRIAREEDKYATLVGQLRDQRAVIASLRRAEAKDSARPSAFSKNLIERVAQQSVAPEDADVIYVHGVEFVRGKKRMSGAGDRVFAQEFVGPTATLNYRIHALSDNWTAQNKHVMGYGKSPEEAVDDMNARLQQALVEKREQIRRESEELESIELEVSKCLVG